jgi:hypothetical protein
MSQPTTAQRLTALETGLAELLNLARGLSPATAKPSRKATSPTKPASPVTAKPSPTKRAKAIQAQKAENIARGYHPQARAICPHGHKAKDGSVRWGIQASWVCANCHEREELRFTAKMPKARK